jgi:hypothetical protein
MFTETTNLKLVKPTEDDFYDIEVMNSNMDKLDDAIGDSSHMKVAGGTGTVITLSISSITAYKAYQKITFIASANNAGAVTTIKVGSLAALPLYKPNTTTTPTLTAGKAYEIWVSSDLSCFFLKASAEGNAVAANVLAGKTFSNSDDTSLTGTIANKVDAWQLASWSNPQNDTVIDVPIPAAGYYDTTSVLQITDSDLVSSNIKAGVNIFGVAGKSSVVDTADGDATSGSILQAYAGYANGVKYNGNVYRHGFTALGNPVKIITPSTTTQAITQGYYGGTTSHGYVEGDLDLISANIKAGANIFGVQGNINVVDTSAGDAVAADILSGKKAYVDGALVTGSMANHTTDKQAIAVAVFAGRIMLRPTAGKYDGVTYTYYDDPDFLAANIVKDKNLFGLIGTFDKTYGVGDQVTYDKISKIKNVTDLIWRYTSVPTPPTTNTNFYDIGVDRFGNIYCPMYDNTHYIVKFNSAGAYITKWSVPNLVQRLVVDDINDCMYYFMSSTLYKADLNGNVITSVALTTSGWIMTIDYTRGWLIARYNTTTLYIYDLNLVFIKSVVPNTYAQSTVSSVVPSWTWAYDNAIGNFYYTGSADSDDDGDYISNVIGVNLVTPALVFKVSLGTVYGISGSAPIGLAYSKHHDKLVVTYLRSGAHMVAFINKTTGVVDTATQKTIGNAGVFKRLLAHKNYFYGWSDDLEYGERSNKIARDLTWYGASMHGTYTKGVFVHDLVPDCGFEIASNGSPAKLSKYSLTDIYTIDL